MMLVAHRWENRMQLTPEDEAILHFGMGHHEQYEYAIADRNDYAVMLARTTLAHYGCRALRGRMLVLHANDETLEEVDTWECPV